MDDLLQEDNLTMEW